MYKTDNITTATGRTVRMQTKRDYFEQRQEQILREINRARFSIWFMVTDFSDEVLMQELIRKVKERVNVEIVIARSEDDETKSKFRFDEFVEAGGEIYYAGEEHYEKIRHNRFCIIDMKTVIKGIITDHSLARKFQMNLSIFKNSTSVANHFIRGYFTVKNTFARAFRV